MTLIDAEGLSHHVPLAWLVVTGTGSMWDRPY
jgi:hypothetical protein